VGMGTVLFIVSLFLSLLHIKFLALNVDFICPSSDFLGSRKPAHAGVKEGYSPKTGYFTAIGS